MEDDEPPPVVKDDDEQPEDDQPQAEDEDEGPSPAPPTSPPPADEEGAQDDSLVSFGDEEATADVLEMLPEDTDRDLQKMIDDTNQRLDNLVPLEQADQPTASGEPLIGDLLGDSDGFPQPAIDAAPPPPSSLNPFGDMFSFGDSSSGDQTVQIPPSFDSTDFPPMQPELAPLTGDLLGGDFSFGKPADEGGTSEAAVVEESTLIDLGGPEQ